MTTRKSLAGGALILVALATALAMVWVWGTGDVAHGSTLTVTSTGDSGPGTLRQVIADASADDTITFSVRGAITLTDGNLVIDRDLTIEGPGAESLAISGNSASRVLWVKGGIVNISGVTIRNGSIRGSSGGGIFNDGSLTLTNSVIRDNRATERFGGGSGGGIYNAFGRTLNLVNSTLSGNSAGIDAGAIHNNGLLSLTNSTLSSNTALDDGGGIYNTVTMIMTNSTLSSNTALDDGGGIWSRGIANLINSTINGNAANGSGGGIKIHSGNLILTNNIIANTLVGGDCSGNIISRGHNLDSDGSCGLSITGDLSNTNPRLGFLKDNGGPTLTHELLLGSPAIDAGNDAFCPPTDQRGVARPQGAGCDIGAFEVENPPPDGDHTCNEQDATIVGTNGDDILRGTPDDDVIAGLEGDDVILGMGGNDTICAGDGEDVVKGGPGRDWVSGGPGDDVVLGGSGNDTRLSGDDGDDMVRGGGGNNKLLGGGTRRAGRWPRK